MWISYFNDLKITAIHQARCVCQNWTKTFSSHPHCPFIISTMQYLPRSLTILLEPDTPFRADQILHNFGSAQMPRINSSTAGSLPFLSVLFEQSVIWSAGNLKQCYLVCSITLLIHPDNRAVNYIILYTTVAWTTYIIITQSFIHSSDI